MSSPIEHPEVNPDPTTPTAPPAAAESPTAARKEKPKVSPARNAVSLVLLVVLLVIGGLELTALFRFNGAVGRLDQALESNEADLIARGQVEELLGKQADSPLSEDPTGMLTTYTWRGALRSHVLSAYYSYGDDPGLLRYEIWCAEGVVSPPQPEVADTEPEPEGADTESEPEAADTGSGPEAADQVE